jgi:hypothetical protein
VRLEQLFVTDILHFFYTPEKATLEAVSSNQQQQVRRRQGSQAASSTGCLAAIGALKKGRSRHIRLTVPHFLNAKKATKKGDVA